MMLPLFRVDIQNLPLILREHRPVMEHGVATQCRCDNGRNVESLLTLGFSDGSTEVPQCADDSIIHHQHYRRLFVGIRYAHG